MKPLLAAFLFSLAAVTMGSAQDVSARPRGVLLLAHGGQPVWNQTVLALARELDGEQPTEVAFGMATRATISAAVHRLLERGVGEIVAVPLFISSHSSVVRASEYLLGLRDDAPADLVRFAQMNHGAHGHHASDPSRPDTADPASPIRVRIPVRMTEALNRHPLVAQILSDRATSVSTDPSREVVVLVAHGPVPDDDNDRWLEDLAALADQMRAGSTYKGIEFQTVRDDAPEPVRGRAALELRTRVERITASGDRALVVPVLLSYGGIEQGIRQRLEGLEYSLADRALLPDQRVHEWVRLSVQRLASGSRSVDRRPACRSGALDNCADVTRDRAYHEGCAPQSGVPAPEVRRDALGRFGIPFDKRHRGDARPRQSMGNRRYDSFCAVRPRSRLISPRLAGQSAPPCRPCAV